MCERHRNLRAEARRAADKSLISAGDECRGGPHSGQSAQNKVEVLKHWIMTSSDSVHFLDVATTRFSHLRRYVLQTSDRYRHTMHWGEERQWVCTVCNVSAGHNVARWAGKCPLCGSDGWCSVFTLYTSHRPQQPQVRGCREYFHRGIIINYAGQRSAPDPAPPPPRPRPRQCSRGNGPMRHNYWRRLALIISINKAWRL